MSHQEYVGMKDLFFASPTMLATRHASMPPRGIGFLLLSIDEEGRNALLVPIGQDDPLNNVADLTSQSDRFRCHIGFVPLLTLILIASPLLFTRCPPVIWFRLWFAYRTSPGRQSERDGSKSTHRHLCMDSFLAAYL
jgi:hypothetical protein